MSEAGRAAADKRRSFRRGGSARRSPGGALPGVTGAADDIGPFRGKNALRAWLEDWFDMFDGFEMDLVELIDSGEGTVVWVERYGARAKRSGIQIKNVIAGLHDPQRKARPRRDYATREQALEAAGLQK